MAGEAANPTASVLAIGDELLSGRTKDRNIGYLAETLTDIGIDVVEARIVGDDKAAIVAAVRDLAPRTDYVFTTGGIGPTMDDVTAEAIAEAFEAPLGTDQEAVARLSAHLARHGREMNAARLRMARIPQGARLIDNPVSAAPGFALRNVYVMAGIPAVMQAMLDTILPSLAVGRRILSETVEAGGRGEGDVAELMERLAAMHPGVRIGSYPYFDGERHTTRLVLRGRDERGVQAAAEALRQALDATARPS